MAVRSNQVAVDATAGGTLVAGPAAGDKAKGGSAVILNDASSANDVYVGPSGVTTATGFLVGIGKSLSADLEDGDRLYAITAAAGSATVYVLETRKGVSD